MKKKHRDIINKIKDEVKKRDVTKKEEKVVYDEKTGKLAKKKVDVIDEKAAKAMERDYEKAIQARINRGDIDPKEIQREKQKFMNRN